MKKILMVLTFLLMVAMIPAAHATIYELRADEIWVNTGIYLAAAQSITFSGGRTYTTYNEIPSDRNIVRPAGTILNGWEPTIIDEKADYYRNEWTWGVEWYAKPTTITGYSMVVPYVWTGADGGDGGWVTNGDYQSVLGYDPGLDNDEWLQGELHGMLIGYIGGLDPLKQGGVKNALGLYVNDDDKPNLAFRTDPNMFFIGTGTRTITALEDGFVWIGMNDDFVDEKYGPEDNFGYAYVNIPEPASMLLLFFGLMGVLGLRRKFKS